MAKKGQYPIPFCAKTGDLLSYGYGYDGIEWRDNYVFDDKLTYESYGRGRSSATIHLVDSKKVAYEMFLSDFDDMMHAGGFDGKTVNGRWTFVKKGQNYGIRMVMDGESA